MPCRLERNRSDNPFWRGRTEVINCHSAQRSLVWAHRTQRRRYPTQCKLPRDLLQRPRVPDHRIRIPSAFYRIPFRQEFVAPCLPMPLARGIHLYSRLPGTFTDRILTVLDADWRVVAAHVSPSPAAGFDTRHEKTGGAAPPISIAPGCAPKRSHASVERSTRGQW